MKDFEEVTSRGFGTVSINKNTDNRGSLCYAEWEDLPFVPKRLFWIHDVREGMSRGCHSHSDCEEVVFAVNGGFDIFVDNGRQQATIRVDNPQRGVYVGRNVWCELKNFAPGTVCVVVASVRYMKEGYVNEYEVFKQKSSN